MKFYRWVGMFLAAAVLLSEAAFAQAGGFPFRFRKGTGGVNLDNLVPYTYMVPSWSDRYSTVAISWPKAKQPGLQSMVSMMGHGSTAITTDSLLRWSLLENGRPLPLAVQGRNFRPDKVIETDVADGLEMTATAAWPERNGLAIEFTIKNLKDTPRTLTLEFTTPGTGRRADWQGLYPVPKGVTWKVPSLHFVGIDGEPQGSWSTLYPVGEHGRLTIWVQTYVAGLTNNTSIEMVCIAGLAPRALTVKPGGTARVAVALGFGRWRREARDTYEAVAAKIGKGWTPAEETRRMLKLLKSVPPLPAKYRGQEKYERLYAHAVTSLEGLFVRGDGGFTGAKRLPWTAKYGIGLGFFWDTSFSCVGGREFNAAACQEAIECFTDQPSPRGSLPGTICDTNRAGEGQSPIMSWSAWSIYQCGRDKAWLARVYPRLAANNDFWFKYHASPRGLCQFFNAGQVADNDARFDPVQGENTGNQNLKGFESPDLNSFLVMDMNCLGEMAEALGRPEEAARWREKAAALGRLIVETMYFPEDAMFHDVRTGTREKLSDVKGPNMFLPLWAGVPLPQAEVKKIVERHMLNPAEFYRELPFPSLSYDNPKYDPVGYWRGRIWPHVVYWMIQTLWRQGYHAEAEVTADRLLNLMQSTPWLHECYASKEGMPPGMAEYNWSAATTIELLLERYKEPLP